MGDSTNPKSNPPALAGAKDLIGEIVVVDTDSRFVYLGTLAVADPHYLRLVDVDVHEALDVGSSKERYIHDARKIGVRPTRKMAWVNGAKVMSISRLEDIEQF